MLKIINYVAAAVLIANPASAGRSDRASSKDPVEAADAPSITLGQAGVILVLPEQTFQEARAAGHMVESEFGAIAMFPIVVKLNR